MVAIDGTYRYENLPGFRILYLSLPTWSISLHGSMQVQTITTDIHLHCCAHILNW